MTALFPQASCRSRRACRCSPGETRRSCSDGSTLGCLVREREKAARQLGIRERCKKLSCWWTMAMDVIYRHPIFEVQVSKNPNFQNSNPSSNRQKSFVMINPDLEGAFRPYSLSQLPCGKFITMGARNEKEGIRGNLQTNTKYY